MNSLALIEIIRPKQWYKNFLVFIPLIFVLHLFDTTKLLLTISGFAVFCLSFSGSYIINDILDYKKDAIHPQKMRRPIPSGKLSKKQALTFAIILLTISEISSYYLNLSFLLTNSILICLTLIYSIQGKNIFLVDIFLISINYVLRAVGGAFVIGEKISPWLIMGVFFLALLLALGKRQNEISLLKEKAIEHRKILDEYSPEILRYSITITSATIILAYSIYSMTGPIVINDWRLVLTIPVAFFILIMYINRINSNKYNEKELNDLLATDKKLMLAVLIYVIQVILLLYFIPHDFFK